MNALNIMEISKIEQREILNIIASVLHLGNIGFTQEDGRAKVLKPEFVAAVSEVNILLIN